MDGTFLERALAAETLPGTPKETDQDVAREGMVGPPDLVRVLQNRSSWQPRSPSAGPTIVEDSVVVRGR